MMQCTRFCSIGYLHTLGNEIVQSFLFCSFNTWTWRHSYEHWILAAIWHSLAFSLLFFSLSLFFCFVFLLLMKTILFLYSLGNQHSDDLPFHVMCYRRVSVLFAVTSICCTCCLCGQRDICHVSLHFVPQVAFSQLNLLLVFLQWLRGPFLQCDVLFTHNELIFSEKMANSNTLTRVEEVWLQSISIAFTINIIIFCH